MSPRPKRDQPYKYQRIAADLQQITAGLADGERLRLNPPIISRVSDTNPG
jgi:hypothetical protein